MLFEAFTPADNPRIAAIVALEAGRGGGRDAAPIVRRMMDAWLLDQAQAQVQAPEAGEQAGNR